MIVGRCDPVNLFEMLDDDELFNLVKAGLLKRHPNSARLGRRPTPVEVVLRMLVVKRLHDSSHEKTERFVNDSIVLRQFRRLCLERAPDDATLIRWADAAGPEAVAALNERRGKQHEFKSRERRSFLAYSA